MPLNRRESFDEVLCTYTYTHVTTVDHSESHLNLNNYDDLMSDVTGIVFTYTYIYHMLCCVTHLSSIYFALTSEIKIKTMPVTQNWKQIKPSTLHTIKANFHQAPKILLCCLICMALTSLSASPFTSVPCLLRRVQRYQKQHAFQGQGNATLPVLVSLVRLYEKGTPEVSRFYSLSFGLHGVLVNFNNTIFSQRD